MVINILFQDSLQHNKLIISTLWIYYVNQIMSNKIYEQLHNNGTNTPH